MKKILTFFKNLVLLVAVFLVSMQIFSTNYSDSIPVPVAGFALTIVIVFVWKKVSRKYL